MLKQQIFNVVIVEDEHETRQRLVRVIEQSQSLRCVAACGDVSSGRRALIQHAPDIIMVDINLPDGSGIELIELIGEKKLDTRAIVITVFEDDRHIMHAISAGATGYVLKDDPSISIEQAIHMILDGGAPISPTVARHILDRFKESKNEMPASGSPEKIQSLTPREREILILVSDGFTDQEIAYKVNISYHTVTTHVKHIYQKLCVNTRVDAAREAIRFGIVGSD